MSEEIGFDELLDSIMPEQQEEEILEEENDAEQEAAMEELTAEQQHQLKMDLLGKHGLSEEHYVAWKQRFGFLGLFAPKEEDIYIWRQLRRPEWEKIQARAQSLPEDKQNPDVLKKMVLRLTVLFPRLEEQFFANSPAGLIDSLFEIVMHGSYFFSPQEALSYVIEL